MATQDVAVLGEGHLMRVRSKVTDGLGLAGQDVAFCGNECERCDAAVDVIGFR